MVLFVPFDELELVTLIVELLLVESAIVTMRVSYSIVALVDETPSISTVEFNPLFEAKTF